MVNTKFVRFLDGRYRFVYYDENGYLQINAYAKDFQKLNNCVIIGKYNEPTAQELIDEVESERGKD